MKQPHNQIHTIARRFEAVYSQAGTTAIFLSITMSVLCGFAAVSVDLSLARVQQRRLHYATDAGALAGVGVLSRLQFDENWDFHAYPQATVDLVNDETIEITQANSVGVEQSDSLQVQIGYLDSSRAFYDMGSMPSGTDPNAVRVTAWRLVPTPFGRVLGQETLRPVASSMAVTSGANDVTCMVPFAIDDDLLVGKTYGDQIDIDHNSPGNWGKIDLGGNMSSGSNFEDAMENGVCWETFSINQLVSPGTGFAEVRQGFRRRIAKNPLATIAVVDDFPNGNSSDMKILGFIVTELLREDNGGANWTGSIKFLNRAVGSGIGGPTDAPYAPGRTLLP